jgi:hypothetical protein
VIVGTFFAGDEDTKIAWKQHDVYGEALEAIIKVSNRLTLFAKSLLDDKAHASWGTIETCDHRTLQGAHDILAAAWRFQNDFRQSDLPLERRHEPLVPHTPENLWLWWLRDEIERWVCQAALVRDVQMILGNQNQPIGYAAESRLCLALINRFHAVPWLPNWRDAFEQALASDLARSAGLSREPQPNNAASMPCECTAEGGSACNMIPCKTTAARAARKGCGTLE